MSAPNQPTPPSSTSSTNGASPDGQQQQFRVVRKRNRIPLSCAPCRHRKLKCNRGHPCDNCTKRGDTASCSYATQGNRKKSTNGPTGTPDDMQNRIDRLEGLVLSLMGSGQPGGGNVAAAQAAITASRSTSLSNGSELRLEGSDVIPEEAEGIEEDSEVEQVSRGIGIMKVDNGRAVFASDAHWYAILGELTEVKKYFAEHKQDYNEHMQKVQAAKANESPGTAFLLQGPPAKTHSELLAALPPKTDADRLIARYFNAYDPSMHVIHGPTFQKQYDRHWLNPSESSVLWVGLCFAMMTLALQSYHKAGDEPPEYRGRALELSHEFRRLTAQCLLLADITQPLPGILETLVLHVQAEYGRSRDAEPGVLLITSLCVRVAMRMGYHRDPGPYPLITPFQGEMRRRLWCFVRAFDLLISFQFGMPPMIRSDYIDTEPPRNLYDDELHEDMTSLPPSRPTFEATPVSYMIAKSKMTLIFGRIVERIASLTDPPSYDETMKLDQELREARSTHPPLLQMRPFPESARDPANLIMQRLGLEMVYLRSLFVLHRRFIARGRENPRYAYSRRTCIDASMELLSHQATLHAESRPDGRLRSVKWYVSSLTTHDFLLAGMLVCLDLYHQAKAECRGRSNRSPNSPTSGSEMYQEDRRDEMLAAVEHCITIWESVRGESMEAYKASITLKVMFDKLKAHQAQQAALQGLGASQSGNAENFTGQQQQSQQTSGGARQYVSPLTGLPNGHPTFGTFPNGMVSDFSNGDDLPPEQSAAMTLGMLSSGGMSPNTSCAAAAAAANFPSVSMADGAKQSGSFPAGMAGLLNDPMTTERTGLTPGYSGPDGGGQSIPGAASSFGGLFGTGASLGFADGGMGDIDWGMWDNYVANNTAMDGGGSMWPMNLDLDAMGAMGGFGTGSSPPPQQQQGAQQAQ